jgi:predicted nuclease with TOPRIM domain
MSFENFPKDGSNDPEFRRTEFNNNSNNSNNLRNILIGGLIVALLGTWAYIIWDKSKTKEEKEQLTTQIITSDSSKNELQRELNDAAMRLDMLKTTNSRADSLLKTKDNDIQALRSRVQTILNKQNATASELAEARRLINQLKGNIENYTAEIEKLQGEKIQLAEEKRVVTQERNLVRKHFDSAKNVIKEKEDLIDVGSTLHASNFSIIGVKEKSNGKEKETTTAKRVDKLRISFDIDENRITPSGTKDIFVSITAPDGTPIAVEALGSGTFVTREGIERQFTKRVQVDYKQGEKQQVNVEWKPENNLQTGNYRIEIYNNGFKIGEGVRAFKKGGLFG